MELKIKSMLAVAMMAAACFTTVSCDDDDDDDDDDNNLSQKETFLATTNSEFVSKSVHPIYTALMNADKALLDAVENMQTQTDVDNACTAWRTARQYWEWSEAFLFGAATDYAIDPHTDTWPFDRQAFDNYIARYPDLATNETAQGIVSEAIATGQNLTGFHAVEYLLFRKGQPRKIADITDNEKWFAHEAASDLYLASIKLVSSWGGDISDEQQKILDDAEFESAINYGENIINSGKAGSTYRTVTLGTIQILEGASDIATEVADSKIGNCYTGVRSDYIESPYAYNSITDFYDNIKGCQFTIYGGFNPSSNAYTSTSIMAYAMANYPTEAANLKSGLEHALTAIQNMKPPFALYFTDSSCQTAMDAIHEFDDALKALVSKLGE